MRQELGTTQLWVSSSADTTHKNHRSIAEEVMYPQVSLNRLIGKDRSRQKTRVRSNAGKNPLKTGLSKDASDYICCHSIIGATAKINCLKYRVQYSTSDEKKIGYVFCHTLVELILFILYT